MAQGLEEIKLLKDYLNSLINNDVFQTKFTETNSPDKSMWLNEARSYLVKCIGKLNKVLEIKA